jgi:hypothetical protein
MMLTRLDEIYRDVQKLLRSEAARVEHEKIFDTMYDVVMGDQDHPGVKDDAKTAREDHPKVLTMWAVFRPMAWAVTVFIVAVIGLIASGKVQIDIIIK